MKLSTKGRYAARLMVDLALYYGKGPVLLRDIAARQGISEKYLGHLTVALKAAGLINSTRGAHGGYVLSKSPGEITLAEVIQAVEGKLNIVECVEAPQACGRVESCVTRDIWRAVNQKMLEVLDSTTLQDMIEKYKQKQGVDSLTYSI